LVALHRPAGSAPVVRARAEALPTVHHWSDLASGRWSDPDRDLLAHDELDLGYRLFIASP
jgi:hypothetical protein